MVPPSQDISYVTTIFPKPDVIIWYCRISDIIESILPSGLQNDFKSILNEKFQKNDFSSPYFSDAEIHTINSFKALKKQMEWMSGRALIKQMLQHFFFTTTDLGHISLSYLELGAPVVTGRFDIPISLSHSNAYTAAACSLDKGQIIGLDIEKISTTPDHFFMETAFTRKEITHLENSIGPGPVFKNWTIKEAYLKYIKKGFNESLHSVEVINDEIWHNQKKMNVDVFSTGIEDYVLSLVSSPVSS